MPLEGTTFVAYLDSLLAPGERGPVTTQWLPDEPPLKLNEFRWTTGSLDGILSVRGGSSSGDHPALAAAAILEACRWPLDTTRLHVVAERATSVGSPHAIDLLLDAVREGQALNRERLAELARWLCRFGVARAQVKCGLALLGISGRPRDKDLIVRLGLLEEFTLYSLVALQNLLPSPEQPIFDLAQQVSGWGRIHALHRLKATTDPEIQNWMLRGGYDNQILDEEVAFVVATTGDLATALQGEIDESLLDHAGALLAALALGGPAEDMHDYEQSELALSHYLARLEGAQTSLARLRHLGSLTRYLSGQSAQDDHLTEVARIRLHSQATRILARPHWREMVDSALHSEDDGIVGQALWDAQLVGIDPRPVAVARLHTRPHDDFLWQRAMLGATRAEVEDLLAFGRTVIPLASVSVEPPRRLDGHFDRRLINCFDSIIWRLDDFPGLGGDWIAAALTSPMVRNRDGAIQALEAWPREAWPLGVEAQIARLARTETEEHTRARLRDLIAV